MKIAQKVKSLIEFESAQNILLNKPDIVKEKEIVSHIQPSLPDLLNLPKKKDNKKYNTLAMNYLAKIEQGQEEYALYNSSTCSNNNTFNNNANNNNAGNISKVKSGNKNNSSLKIVNQQPNSYFQLSISSNNLNH